MKWRVYNMHPQGFTHTEKFRDEMISIKAGSFVLMDYEDAVLFKGQYFPTKMDAMNQQDPKTFKCIKIEAEEAGSKPELIKTYVCHVDGKEFPSKAELEAYVQAKYGELEPFKDEALDAEIEKHASEEAPRRKPGRPPREKTL